MRHILFARKLTDSIKSFSWASARAAAPAAAAAGLGGFTAHAFD